MQTIFKAFIEFVTGLLLFYVLFFWLQGMWDLSPRPGIEPTPPALESEVLTTGPPGKSPNHFSYEKIYARFPVLYSVSLKFNVCLIVSAS